MATPQCECGRPLTDVIHLVQRSKDHRYTWYRCTQCNREWEVVETVDDLADPVSSSEVLEVHRLLEGDLTMSEITK
jgi:DNA-directed RNA polymerase subunit RPC12/RpoP